LLERLKKSL